MSFINITTNNLSKELNNSITYKDNWVFVPGTTITGNPDGFHFFETLSDFQSTCGKSSPEGSITYEYVAGLLSAGLPVIFKRIASNDTDSDNVQSAEQASVDVTHEDSDGNTVTDITVYEKYGGTYGNDMSITIRDTGKAYYIDVYYNSTTLLESVKIATYDSTTQTQEEINEVLIAALQTAEFERINIEVLVTDASEFSLSTVTKLELTGGTDLDESLVADMIPSVYSDLTDKILYQPLFITSGGYTDTNITTDAPIAEAMKELTYERQDCRALIDLPSNLSVEEQQEAAEAVAYYQTTSSTVIPSASVCAPWVYMQVGNSQLWMPPSYAFLTVVAKDVSKGSKVYTPKAGLSTGIVSNVIKPQFEIGSDVAEQWQADGAVQINPIMKMQSGSYTIMGNSTLLIEDADTENAFLESSADLTIIEIRRCVYNIASELQYQYNSVTTFETFSLRVAKTLDAMKTEGSITQYDIENISSNDEPRKLKVKLDVYLTPTIKEIEIYLNVSYGSVEVTTGGES